MHWTKTTGRREEKHLSFGIWCDLYYRFDGNWSILGCIMGWYMYATALYPIYICRIPLHVHVCHLTSFQTTTDILLPFCLTWFCKENIISLDNSNNVVLCPWIWSAFLPKILSIEILIRRLHITNRRMSGVIHSASSMTWLQHYG